MIVLVGTIPYKTGLYVGKAHIQGNFLNINDISFPIERGTVIFPRKSGHNEELVLA